MGLALDLSPSLGSSSLAPGGGVRVIAGHFQGYQPPGLWTVFMGMWGFAPEDYGVLYTNRLTYQPAQFPNKTKIEWDLPNNRNAVSGYLSFVYGKGLGQSGTNPLTPARLYEISNLAFNIDFALAGDLTSGGLLEFWTTATPFASGVYDASTTIDEIGMIFHPTTHDRSFINAGVQHGSYISGGITWNVARQVSGDGVKAYILAIPSTNIDVSNAAIYVHDYLAFLLNNAHVNSMYYFNGMHIGIEPYNGGGSIDVNALSGSYTAAARKPWASASLAVTALSDTQVKLTCKAISGATSYKYRRDGGAWTSLPDNSLDWTIGSLTASTSYTWEVQGVNSVGDGDPSNLVTRATNAPGVGEYLFTFNDDTAWSNDWDGTTQAVSGQMQYRDTPAFYNRGVLLSAIPGIVWTVGKYYQIEKTVTGYVKGGHQIRLGAGGTEAVGVVHSGNGAPHKERLALNASNTQLLMIVNAITTLNVDELRIRGPYNTNTVDGA